MRYTALATDYDETLAHHGSVSPGALAALRRFRATGRKLILVTGRELDDLIGVFPQIDVFDRVVAENGGLLYCPESKAHRVLGVPPPPEFAFELRRLGVKPLSVGHCIVATVEPHETKVLAAIRDLGLELQVIFNKGAVMVLPAGINKATGLAAALDDLRLSPRNVVAIGDAENDHALLHASEFGIAVGNALAMLKKEADRTSGLSHGEAVAETIEAMLADDLRTLAPVSGSRRTLSLGYLGGGEALTVPVAERDVLVTGASGSGKSVFVQSLLERLGTGGYQYCVVDPEGDYDETPHAVVLGAAERPPSVHEVVNALADNPSTSAIVNLAAVSPQARRSVCKEIFACLRDMRTSLGRPHWWVIGEAHQLCRKDDTEPLFVREAGGSSMIYVSPHPGELAQSVLKTIDLAVVIGSQAQSGLTELARAFGLSSLALPDDKSRGRTQALAWFPGRGEPPFAFEPQPSEVRSRQGLGVSGRRGADLPPERSFYFRGPQGRLNLRAQNIALFLQTVQGVDDETYRHHLRAGDYSRWLRDIVGNAALAYEVDAIEAADGDVAQSRNRLKMTIEAYLETGS
jgi:hydroxymethylpyrimidine pyrophosphatase-like HAD family hydrolase